MISFSSSGSFKNTDKFLKAVSKQNHRSLLEQFGREGVRALSAATPVDSSLTARSWAYEIVSERGGYAIYWRNSNKVAGVNIAVLIQYGHGTGTGGYVQGRDYINPAIQPIFDKIAAQAWKAVTSA